MLKLRPYVLCLTALLVSWAPVASAQLARRIVPTGKASGEAKATEAGGQIAVGQMVPYERVVRGDFSRRTGLARYQTYVIEGRAGDSVTVWIEGSTDLQVMIRKRNVLATVVAKSERGAEVGGAHKLTATIPDDGHYHLQVHPGQAAKGEYSLLLTRSAAQTLADALGRESAPGSPQPGQPPAAAHVTQRAAANEPSSAPQRAAGSSEPLQPATDAAGYRIVSTVT